MTSTVSPSLISYVEMKRAEVAALEAEIAAGQAAVAERADVTRTDSAFREAEGAADGARGVDHGALRSGRCPSIVGLTSRGSHRK